jgi:hypothetical protein
MFRVIVGDERPGVCEVLDVPARVEADGGPGL